MNFSDVMKSIRYELEIINKSELHIKRRYYVNAEYGYFAQGTIAYMPQKKENIYEYHFFRYEDGHIYDIESMPLKVMTSNGWGVYDKDTLPREAMVPVLTRLEWGRAEYEKK